MDSQLSFLGGSAVSVARELIGWRFYKLHRSELVGGIIIETEAYTQGDAASHSYRGETPRNQIMFGPAGYLYVYFTYGMHYCVNIVTADSGVGEAVLLRALVPDKGLDIIRQRRCYRPDEHLTDGPAKLCQALGISLDDNGLQINNSKILLLPPLRQILTVRATTRIGITKNKHKPWRFIEATE